MTIERRKATGWSAYVFGEIGSQELDDFGEAIRRPGVSPVTVRLLVEAMANRARSHFGDDNDGELAALGMMDEADAEMAGLQDNRTPPGAWRTITKSAGNAGNTMTTAMGAA